MAEAAILTEEVTASIHNCLVVLNPARSACCSYLRSGLLGGKHNGEGENSHGGSHSPASRPSPSKREPETHLPDFWNIGARACEYLTRGIGRVHCGVRLAEVHVIQEVVS